jgi:anti-sigma B factor antagonist
MVASTSDLRVQIDSEGSAIVVRPVGEVDVANASAFRAALDVAYEPGRQLIIDLANLSFIDSTGIAALIAAAKRSSRGGFVIRNPSQVVQKVLEITGLMGRFGLPKG